MDREQAAEIHRHLRAAASAINRVDQSMVGLSPEERAAFSKPLGDVFVALHYELLHKAIYRQFPDLKPPSKGMRFVDSKLTWDKVSLPPSVTVLDFDRVLLSELHQHWRKTARVVGHVSEHYAKLGISLDPAIAAARLMKMVETGVIEAAGDLRKWRFSEVRLKG